MMLLERMVLLKRIELSTSPLPRECSTPELQQRVVSIRAAKALSNRCASYTTFPK
jgi:hypothetical protein